MSPLRGLEATVIGGGFVGRAVIRMLLELGIARVRVAERSRTAVARLRHALADGRVEVEHAEGAELLDSDAELLIPCGWGPLVSPANAGKVGARIICGPQLDALQQPEVVSRALGGRGRFVVPPEVAARASFPAAFHEYDGIFAGSVAEDERVAVQLSQGEVEGIAATSTRWLAGGTGGAGTGAGDGVGGMLAELAGSHAADEEHPVLGDRTTRLLAALLEGGWHRGTMREQQEEASKQREQTLQKGTGMDAHARWLQSTVYGGWAPGSKQPLRNSIGRGKLPKSVLRHRRPEYTDEGDW